MQRHAINAPDAPQPTGGYSQGVRIASPARFLFVSGQIPVSADATVPHGFDAQCRLVWAHIEAQLRAADMDLDAIVKVTTYLSDRAHADENGDIRREILGSRSPALTVVVAGIFDPAWLLEIEVIAAD